MHASLAVIASSYKSAVITDVSAGRAALASSGRPVHLRAASPARRNCDGGDAATASLLVGKLSASGQQNALAAESMRATGRHVDEDVLAHISPAHSENINFFGAIEVHIDGELAQLGPTGYRPLRMRDTLF